MVHKPACIPLHIQVNTSHIIYRFGDGSMNRSIELVLLVLPLIGLSWKVAQFTDVEPGLYNPVETFNHQVEIERLNPINKTLRAAILNILLAEFEKLKNTLTDKTKCGLLGNWRRIAYFDTTQGDSCPTGLRTVTKTTTNQTACGRTNTRGGCVSVPIPVQVSYSQVCGIVKGNQDSSPDAFGLYSSGPSTIDAAYVDGVSITHGSPRRHLWTYATGLSELNGNVRYRCPCARSNPNYRSGVPTFVGENFYCESGFPGTTWYRRVVWEDPLWDGQNCVAPGNKCCERYGWFHRNVPSSTDDIELRICADQSFSDEDTLINHYEFWVM